MDPKRWVVGSYQYWSSPLILQDAILREVWASKSSFHTVKEVFAEAQARLLEAGYRERSLDALKYR
jgi:hypothetical protein